MVYGVYLGDIFVEMGIIEGRYEVGRARVYIYWIERLKRRRLYFLNIIRVGIGLEYR